MKKKKKLHLNKGQYYAALEGVCPFLYIKKGEGYIRIRQSYNCRKCAIFEECGTDPFLLQKWAEKNRPEEGSLDMILGVW